MLVARDDSNFTVTTETYTLTFPADRPFVYVDDAEGKRLAELFVLSSVHAMHGRDDTVSVGAWAIEETAEQIVCSLSVQSSVWDQKVYRMRCSPQRFSYEVEIRGTGQLADVHYFGGYSSGYRRWGSGFFRSGSFFKRGFNPEPVAEETQFFAPAASARIDLLGVSLPGKRDWFFTPAPFCFAFEGHNAWIGVGVEAQPSANRWTEYSYHGGLGFHLSLAYEGHTTVRGSYTLPAIGVDFGQDPFAVVGTHVEQLHRQGYAPSTLARSKPEWWYEPIFCGWGAQFALAVRDHGHAPDYARQTLYESWLATLEQHDISPGTVVIDDKWQADYGENQVDAERWPDLRGFIDRQHAADRKVLLWLKAWDPEGVPPEECVTNAAGFPVAVDPSNPAYERRLRASVRRMLSADKYDADGFKIDFTARIPSGPGMRLHGDVWGLELMKLYLGIIYDEAKQTKPDALVITHTPHPYLADVLDMVRLNDTLELKFLADPSFGRNLNAVMTYRAKIVALACPDALIDTDNWPVRDREAWRDYVQLQPELGVPALYFVDRMDVTQEPLEADDYQLIRSSWARYRSERERAMSSDHALADATEDRV